MSASLRTNSPGVVVDPDLVARVQRQISEVIKATVVRRLEQIGGILLREFYDNNVDLYRSTSPAKHASLRALLATCESVDFSVKRTVLANAFQLAAFSLEAPKTLPSSLCRRAASWNYCV